MTDEEYVFRQIEKERKRVGRGAFYKKNGSKSKKCSLPSDNLSKKEREALNGECKTYKKKDFYTWKEFKELPSDLQVAWVNSIINRYGAGMGSICSVVFGCAERTLRAHFERSGDIQFINKAPKGAAAKTAKKRLQDAFEIWKNTQITMCDEDLPQGDPNPAEIEENQPEIEALHETTETEREETVAPAPQIATEPSIPTVLRDPESIAALIAALAGSGAKLTIEVVL